MPIKSLQNFINSLSGRYSLRFVFTVPFVLQVVTITSLVGYLSFRNGQKAVNDLANQLQQEVSARVGQHLNTYLTLPHQLNQLNADAVQQGGVNLQDFQRSGRYLWKQAQVYQTISWLGYYLPTGEGAGAGRRVKGQGLTIDQVSRSPKGIYSAYATNAQGDRLKVVSTIEYNPVPDTWYQNVLKAKKPAWGKVFVSQAFENYVVVPATYPLYSRDRRLVAILGVDLLLSNISDFLRTIKVSPSGKIFIIERSGLLIASSGTQSPSTVVQGITKRLNILDSVDPQMQAVAQQLQTTFGSFSAIQKQQELILPLSLNPLAGQQQRQFVHVTPWQDRFGLDWLVVVIVPESDFMAQINANTQTTLTLCLLALVLSVAISILTARWVTRPVLRLNRAAKAIASGDLEQIVELSERQDAVGELTQSFNNLAKQLQTSFRDLQSLNTALNESQQQLAQTNQTLEQQVQERTRELSFALAQLQDAQNEVIQSKKMVQSEKMADLGQLIAGIAHDINTPLGAIQASIDNITTALETSLKKLPTIAQALSSGCLPDLLTLLDWAQQPKTMLSSREERQVRRQMKQTLVEQGLAEDADAIANQLSKMGVTAPLNPILPLLQTPNAPLLLETVSSLVTIHNNSQNIHLATEKATRIVYSLKRYVHQGIADQPVLASVPDGIETVLTLYQNQIKRGIEVIKTYHTLPAILCYPDELLQVWSNLIGNAIQAMNYQGHLEIDISEQGQQILVQITDSGGGISPVIQKQIFEPFFTTKPVGEGTGLGLSIVRTILNKHQGKTALESKPGRTTFKVWLPIQGPTSQEA